MQCVELKLIPTDSVLTLTDITVAKRREGFRPSAKYVAYVTDEEAVQLMQDPLFLQLGRPPFSYDSEPGCILMFDGVRVYDVDNKGKKRFGLHDIKKIVVLPEKGLGRVDHWRAQIDFTDDGSVTKIISPGTQIKEIAEAAIWFRNKNG